MRRFFLVALLMTVPLGAHAETITATVNGMVCAFCVTGLEKSFRKNPAVTDIKVDLDTRLVTVTIRPGETLSDATIDELVSYSGYDLVQVERSK